MKNRIQKDFFEAINRRDVTPLLGLYSKNAIIHSLEGPLYGPEGMQTILDRWFIAFPDLQIYPLCTAQEEDVIVVHWRAVGTHEKPLLEIPASGKTTAFHGLTCFRHADNQIIEHWACTDYRSMAMVKAQK